MTPEVVRDRKSLMLRNTLGCARYKCTRNRAVSHLDHLAKKRYVEVTLNLKGQYHAIFSNTLKIEKTLFG